MAGTECTFKAPFSIIAVSDEGEVYLRSGYYRSDLAADDMLAIRVGRNPSNGKRVVRFLNNAQRNGNLVVKDKNDQIVNSLNKR